MTELSQIYGQAMRRSATGDRSALARPMIALLVLLLLVAIATSLSTGASGVSLNTIMRLITHPDISSDAEASRALFILYDIRLPRLLMGMLVGAALAVSGVIMQGFFRNPLADPGLVGVSSGAALGAVVMIVLGGTTLAPVSDLLGVFALPVAAFLTGLGTTLFLYKVSTRNGQTSIAGMLLSGIAIGTIANAIIGVMIFIANDNQLRDLNFWTLGSLAGANWIKVVSIAPLIALTLAISMFLSRGLNALTLGESAAHHLGINVQAFKLISIVTVAAGVGASVAVSGGIGFVGIVIPHLLRLMIGPDHRYLLPASALLGAAFLLFADAVSRVLVAPAELPIGIITATVGGPFFLFILLRRRSQLAI